MLEKIPKLKVKLMSSPIMYAVCYGWKKRVFTLFTYCISVVSDGNCCARLVGIQGPLPHSQLPDGAAMRLGGVDPPCRRGRGSARLATGHGFSNRFTHFTISHYLGLYTHKKGRVPSTLRRSRIRNFQIPEEKKNPSQLFKIRQKTEM